MIDLIIKEKISFLPKEIQKKIYIYSIKLFWRSYVPVTAKIPFFYDRMNYVQKTLWEARKNNIHFLHLEFNTLEENKKWIMGCQCDFCIKFENIHAEYCHCAYYTQSRSLEFEDSLYNTMIDNSYSSFWNYYYSETEYGHITGKVYDPLYGSYKVNSNSKKLRSKNKLEFDSFFPELPKPGKFIFDNINYQI